MSSFLLTRLCKLRYHDPTFPFIMVDIEEREKWYLVSIVVLTMIFLKKPLDTLPHWILTSGHLSHQDLLGGKKQSQS